MNQTAPQAVIPDRIAEAYMANDPTGSAAKIAHILRKKANKIERSAAGYLFKPLSNDPDNFYSI